jgi:hypothetical protein
MSAVSSLSERLSENQIAELVSTYRRDGFVAVRGLIPRAEIEAKKRGKIVALNNLMSFAQGGGWDVQRVGPNKEFEPKFVDFATLAIGLYSAAAGLDREEVLDYLMNNYAAIFSDFGPNVRMSKKYPHLPERNVYNFDTGYDLYRSGAIRATIPPELQRP